MDTITTPTTAITDPEPTFVLRAGDHMSEHLLRLWVMAKQGRISQEESAKAWSTANAMAAWRRRQVMQQTDVGPDAFQVDGSIKFFNQISAYGFVLPDDNTLPEVMIHKTVLLHSGFGCGALAPGRRITVMARRTTTGIRVVRVLDIEGLEPVAPRGVGPTHE